MGETWPALNVQQHVTIIFVSCRARPSRIQGCGHLDSTSLSKLVRQCRAGIRGIRETRVCTRSSVIVLRFVKPWTRVCYHFTESGSMIRSIRFDPIRFDFTRIVRVSNLWKVEISALLERERIGQDNVR